MDWVSYVATLIRSYVLGEYGFSYVAGLQSFTSEF